MSESTNISYQPTDGLTYDPTDPKYWDEQALKKEVQRTFEICHGCRMCFKFCDAFPTLFDFLDKRYDGDVKKITQKDTADVMSACFQCKLCEVQCPYTPRDNHEYQLDFPKLVHRYQAQKHKKQGSKFRDKVLADPYAAGKAARASLGMANAMNRVKAHRWFMEKLLGIHRNKQLPDFARSTFESWAKKLGLIKQPSTDIEAVVFQTCYVDNNEPQIGRDTVEVLEKNQVPLSCAKGLDCCGMPSWEHGDIETLRKKAKHNINTLLPYVEKGAKVLAINPTCAMMMRQEYPTLVAEEDRERAKILAAAVQDPGEFLWAIRKEERFNTEVKSKPQSETIAYHAPCHLRAQAVGFKGRDLIRKVLGLQPQTVIECCGHDGTYAMKTEGYEASKRIGKKAFDQMKQPETEIWVTECPLAAIQFEQHAGVKPMHPMSVLAKSYRENGFEK